MYFFVLRAHLNIEVGAASRTVARKLSVGGFCIYAGWLDILKIDKNYTDL